ncbi:MAG: Sensory box histidine kinase/response regulator [Labilithrix sp.]|nr:Sensory box histidine kinase/response regulator [Labilithrix sp.]
MDGMSIDAMRGLVDVLPGAACVHRDGLVVHANRAFALVVGHVEESDLVGVPIASLLVESDRPIFEARRRGISEGNPNAPAITLGWRGRDGSIVPMPTAAARVMVDGAPAIVELGSDPSDSVVSARLATSERLASVGTLAAGVAHEINNPLTFVLANLDYIREQLLVHRAKLSEAAFADLDDLAAEAKSGAERVARTVRSLGVFSRIDEDKRVAVDLLPIMEAALALASNEIRHRARVVKIYRPLPLVVADEARLTQVFFSLLINAAQAIPDGHADENQIDVKTWTEPGKAVVEIRDSGGGIRPEHLSRIFDPFFTTKRQSLGSGLGLAICHGTVQGLGGEIVVESTAGLGATFRVYLPAAPAVPVDRSRNLRVSTGRGRSGKIIVIDDDAAVGAAIRRALGRRHDVITTTNAHEALERVRNGELFDLILCDLMMPLMSGMELHAALLAEAPEQAARMVFVTGGAFTVSAREFLDRIPNERFDKPFDASRLRLLAKTMVDEHPRAGDSVAPGRS